MKRSFPEFYSLRVFSFHMNLKRIRIERGYSQEEFAEMANISVNYLSRLESRKSTCMLTDHTLCWLAHCLDVKPEALTEIDELLRK